MLTILFVFIGDLGIGAYQSPNGKMKQTAYITVKKIYNSSVCIDGNEVDEPERVIFCFKYALENWSNDKLVSKNCKKKKDIINRLREEIQKVGK